MKKILLTLLFAFLLPSFVMAQSVDDEMQKITQQYINLNKVKNNLIFIKEADSPYTKGISQVYTAKNNSFSLLGLVAGDGKLFYEKNKLMAVTIFFDYKANSIIKIKNALQTLKDELGEPRSTSNQNIGVDILTYYFWERNNELILFRHNKSYSAVDIIFSTTHTPLNLND